LNSRCHGMPDPNNDNKETKQAPRAILFDISLRYYGVELSQIDTPPGVGLFGRQFAFDHVEKEVPVRQMYR
jgi:hypothetical protein